MGIDFPVLEQLFYMEKFFHTKKKYERWFSTDQGVWIPIIVLQKITQIQILG